MRYWTSRLSKDRKAQKPATSIHNYISLSKTFLWWCAFPMIDIYRHMYVFRCWYTSTHSVHTCLTTFKMEIRFLGVKMKASTFVSCAVWEQVDAISETVIKHLLRYTMKMDLCGCSFKKIWIMTFSNIWPEPKCSVFGYENFMWQPFYSAMTPWGLKMAWEIKLNILAIHSRLDVI